MGQPPNKSIATGVDTAGFARLCVAGISNVGQHEERRAHLVNLNATFRETAC